MEYIANALVSNYRQQLTLSLISEYRLKINTVDKDLDKFNHFINNKSKKVTSAITNRCTARVWDMNMAQLGLETQCSKKCLFKTTLCAFHSQLIPADKQKCKDCSNLLKKEIFHTYQWERHGLFNKEKPHFYKVIKEKYTKKKTYTLQDSDSESDNDNGSDNDNDNDNGNDNGNDNDKYQTENQLLTTNLKSLLKRNEQSLENANINN